MSNNEDLFKLFAWRECDNKEITSITTPAVSSSFNQFNKISIKPIKTMNHLNRDNLRVWFYKKYVFFSFKFYFKEIKMKIFLLFFVDKRYNFLSKNQLLQNNRLNQVTLVF
jgi:hypothetical protein